MTRPSRALLFLWVALVAGASPAVEVDGLFEAAVVVSDQSAGERKRAVAEGFRQVLVKAAGQRSVLSLPAIKSELSRADALLGSFRYEGQAARNPADPRASALRLRLEFDPAGVRSVLNRAAAPVWGADRPPVHLWVVRGGDGKGALAALGTPQADVLLEAAAARGLPVVMPSPGDTVAPAGTRIAVLATLATVAGMPHVNGVLQVEGGSEQVEVSAVDEAAALRELVELAADRLAARYAVAARADQARVLRLRLAGIGQLEGWADAQRWLAAQPLVKEVSLEAIAGERATLLLVLAGDADRLAAMMRADARFVAVGSPVADGPLHTLEASLAPVAGR